MRKLRLLTVLSLILLVPVSRTRAQITKSISGTVRYQSGMSQTKFLTPAGNVVMHLPQSLSGDIITGTVSTEPAGISEKEKKKNLKELLKYVVILDGQKIPFSATPQNFDWLTHLDRSLRTPIELLDISGMKIAEVSLPPVLAVPKIIAPGGPAQLTTPSNVIVKGDALNVYTNHKFLPGEKFVLTDSKGRQFTLDPVCLSFQQAVLTIPEEAKPGNYRITRDNKPASPANFHLIDINLSSPNTNLKPGETSFVDVDVLTGAANVVLPDYDQSSEARDPDPPLLMGVDIDIRNLNPAVVTMEGGDLQQAGSNQFSKKIFDDDQQVLISRLTRNITGKSAGIFSVNATLHENYNSCNDPFLPQVNALNTPEQFNDWTAALLQDLKEYALMQPGDLAGQATWSNINRLLVNMPVCRNVDQLAESKAMALDLLRPINVSKRTAIRWRSSFEAGKIAATGIEQNLAGNPRFIDWNLILGGLEYVQNRGNRLNDPGLIYSARNEKYLVNEMKQKKLDDPQLAELKTRLDKLNNQANRKDSSEIWVHLDTGKYKTEYIPSDHRHVGSGPLKSDYLPKWLKHAALEGPRESWYVPESYIHVDSGWDKSNYISPLVKHATEEGPDKSNYVPDDWYHLKTGPSKSIYLPKSIRHIDTGANKSRIEYDVPGVDKPIREWEFQQRDKPATNTGYYLHNIRSAEKSNMYNPWQKVEPMMITWNKEGNITRPGIEKNEKTVYDPAQQVNFSPYPPGYFSRYFIGPPNSRAIEAGPEKFLDIGGKKKHAAIEGRRKSDLVPDDYKHASEQGPDKSEYFHPEFKHASEEGPDKSKYLFEHYHASENGPEKSRYIKYYLKHVAEEGPDKSKYVDKTMRIHAWIEGPDKSKYLDYDLHHEETGADKSKYTDKWRERIGYHAFVEGPDKSKYFLVKHKHAEAEGYFKSRYVLESLTHVAEEGQDKSRYVDTTLSKHAEAEGFNKSSYVDKDFSHVSEEGPSKSAYLDKKYWKHVSEEDPDKSKYKMVPTPRGHILSGIDKSRHRSRRER